MKVYKSKIYIWLLFLIMILTFNTTTMAAVRKNVKYCNFTVSRTKVNKKALKVKKGNINFNLKRGYIRFVAPSRGKYIFAWTGPKTGQRLDITPMYTLNKQTLSCLQDFYPDGGSSNTLFFIGFVEYTKYSELGSDRYGGSKYSLVLDKGEEIYFYVKLTGNREAEAGLKITRKAAPKDKKPAPAKIISNFEKLKQSIEESCKSKDGDTFVLTSRWSMHSSSGSGTPYAIKLTYIKSLDQIVFEYDRGNKTKEHLSMAYDKSVISNGVINIHATEYEGSSVKSDANAKVNIYTAKHNHNIKFDIKRYNTKRSINYYNSNFILQFEYFLMGMDSMVLEDLGMTVKDLGFLYLY